ncbi:MAG: 2,3-bisphosphoglycerate-dependent phosphoglycerate mutase [Waddliaceae bacterium]
MSVLILMRHGESVWNKRNQFTGWVDVPLSEKGIKEALEGGKKIADIPIDVIIITTLIRAQMTAYLAMSQHHSKKVPIVVESDEKLKEWGKIYSEEAKENSIPVYKCWELNERMYGELQGFNKAKTAEKFGKEQVHTWRRSFDIAPPNGESLKMTSERSIPYFENTIVPMLAEGKNVFVSAHGNSIRSIIMDLDNLSEEEVVNLEVPTGEPIIYDYLEGTFKKRK